MKISLKNNKERIFIMSFAKIILCETNTQTKELFENIKKDKDFLELCKTKRVFEVALVNMAKNKTVNLKCYDDNEDIQITRSVQFKKGQYVIIFNHESYYEYPDANMYKVMSAYDDSYIDYDYLKDFEGDTLLVEVIEESRVKKINK